MLNNLTGKIAKQMLTISAAAGLCCGSASYAQQPKLPRKPKTQAEVEMQTYFHRFDKPMNLPEVPDIGGHAKFRFGLEHTDPSGVVSIGQRYGTSSSAAEVINFYKTSLLQQQWKLSSVSTNGVKATKQDKSISINIYPRGSADTATDFMVNYSYKGHQ